MGRHERSYGKQQQVLDLEHYLDVLENKPGAMAGSKPLEQCRQSGRWPASYDRFWEGLIERQGKQQGTREMIAILKLDRVHGSVKLKQAIESAVDLGCPHLAAVQYLLTADRLARTVPEMVDIGLLERYERPMPVMTGCDRLLKWASAIWTERERARTGASNDASSEVPTLRCSRLPNSPRWFRASTISCRLSVPDLLQLST